jgi:hypothetical protein
VQRGFDFWLTVAALLALGFKLERRTIIERRAEALATEPVPN